MDEARDKIFKIVESYREAYVRFHNQARSRHIWMLLHFHQVQVRFI